VRDVESAHPYSNNLVLSWSLQHAGAAQMKVHFSRVDVEKRYDKLIVHAPDAEAPGQVLDGQHSELWSEPVAGERLALTLRTDDSVTPWGFAVDQVSVYEQLPPGVCNTSDDCASGQFCVPHQCFNAYAPCHGSCQGGSACDDGSALACRMMVPICPAGTELAVQNSCYACVDPATCQLPAQAIERRYQSDEPLAIPDNTPAGVVSELDVDEVFACTPELLVDLRVRHPWAGDLVIALEDPTGHSTVLWQRQGGSQDDVVLSERVLTGVLPQGRANGIWKLHLSDHAARDVGQLEGWGLFLACR
jgi:hypothetical protein